MVDKEVALRHYTAMLEEARAMNRDEQLKIATRQLAQYLPAPRKAGIVDAMIGAWNDALTTGGGLVEVEAHWCERCEQRPATEGDMCQPCFDTAEAEQDRLMDEAKELQRELSRDPADHDDHCNEMRHPHLMACNCEGAE